MPFRTFNDFMNGAGFNRIERADSPRSSADFIPDGLGQGTSSASTDSATGGSNRINDLHSGFKDGREFGQHGRPANLVNGQGRPLDTD
jgi:hypothetical protein